MEENDFEKTRETRRTQRFLQFLSFFNSIAIYFCHHFQSNGIVKGCQSNAIICPNIYEIPNCWLEIFVRDYLFNIKFIDRTTDFSLLSSDIGGINTTSLRWTSSKGEIAIRSHNLLMISILFLGLMMALFPNGKKY